MAPAPRILLMSHASGALLGNCPGSPQRQIRIQGDLNQSRAIRPGLGLPNRRYRGCGIDFHELGSTPPFSAGNCQPRGNMARFDKHPLDWVPRCRQPSGRKQTTFDNNVTGRLVAALCPEGGKNCSIIISRAHGIFPRAWKCRYVTALLVVQTDLRGV
ncbi:hypothetical protein B0H14DRAFT_3705671 [Mycena olivaceomarginata]|nr:hypothetical protein B0H14DRAFT_3705671 [Mycena olivaceomarginata]